MNGRLIDDIPRERTQLVMGDMPDLAGHRDRGLRLRVAIAAVLTLLSIGLAGCGEPDDGGGGYLTQQFAGQAPA